MYVNIIKKRACVYIYVCESCLDKYINVVTWSSQTKISSSAPANLIVLTNKHV